MALGLGWKRHLIFTGTLATRIHVAPRLCRELSSSWAPPNPLAFSHTSNPPMTPSPQEELSQPGERHWAQKAARSQVQLTLPEKSQERHPEWQP